tara:strand:+ start:123 stop:980 length:858 start_codon:yes stop_codon:yes gene_type:complete
MSISDRAVLVQLNISSWGTERLDKSQTERINVLNNADAKAGKVHKDLMCGTTLAKDIDLHVGRSRLWNNQNTMPWQDRGARLLPTSLFLSYKDEMNSRETNFETMVNRFVPNYAAAKQTARNYLGSMYREEDYPDVNDIASKYKWTLSVSPIPSSGHFCLDVPAEDLENVRKSCDDFVEQKVAEAMRKPWEDLHNMLTGMSGKLQEVDELNGTPKRFHETFVTNALDLCKLLNHMNITNDPQLDKARQQLELVLAGTDVDDIKENEFVRSDMKKRVDNILNQFDW